MCVATLLTACDESNDEGVAGGGSADNSIYLSEYSFSKEESQTTIIYSGAVDSEWSADITDGEDFVSFMLNDESSHKEGLVSEFSIQNKIYIYIDENDDESARSARISFTMEGKTPVELILTQSGDGSEQGGGDGSTDDDQDEEDEPQVDDPLAEYDWAELPAYVNDDNYMYVTHFTTLNSKSVRNFTMCYDIENYAARWVAFPFHDAYDGSVGRNESWKYDPEIPEEYQPNLSGSYSGSWDRGHQLASSDRQATTEMNKQTFYYSNMTPQLGTLNQQIWAQFEIKVRDQVCSDTLYVVTGADFSQYAGTTTDKSGKACPLPNGYYKVMLRTITGNTGKAISECSADELKAIGYWFEHEYYSSMPSPMSVADIEELTGFEFFPDAPAEVKESFKSSLWTF